MKQDPPEAQPDPNYSAAVFVVGSHRVASHRIMSARKNDEAAEAARKVCQEARTMLTSLRGGPPTVARGDLAQDLIELRHQMIQYGYLEHPGSTRAAAGGPPSPFLVDPSRPFLQVVTDPRAAGPHTLVALRAIRRLVEGSSNGNSTTTGSPFEHFRVPRRHLLEGVLGCKFEQTDAAEDESVEMAIADVLALLVASDASLLELPNRTVMDAFNTVFVTRNTFVHSPSLCYHFEDVLRLMVASVFGGGDPSAGGSDPPDDDKAAATSPSSSSRERQCMIFQFLVSQLLHTPLVGTPGGASDMIDDATREAQLVHDATRVLCLRLVRTAISALGEAVVLDPTILQMIQDDLCLSLIMTGQAIWAYNNHNNTAEESSKDPSPGFVSLELLTEITATIDELWNHALLRPHIVVPFQAIWTGLYTRALVLLRKRRVAEHSRHYHSNLMFDAEVEVLLESLADLMSLRMFHNGGDGDDAVSPAPTTTSSAVLNGSAVGALESIFVHYDCNLHRSDVGTDIVVELSRCCGGTVNEDGEAVLTSLTPSSSALDLFEMLPDGGGSASSRTHELGSSSSTGGDRSGAQTPPNATNHSETPAPPPPTQSPALLVEHPLRQVPPHLKELCAQALMGGMKCLFRDDRPSDETLKLRGMRKQSIMLRHVEPLSVDVPHAEKLAEDSRTSSGHHLRDLKSKKRLMRKAARIFNKKASKGIEFLLDSGLTPDPVTPESIAAFLRNGIVVGLDKKAVGMYLGESGKSPVAGKSPPDWERDWFHKEVLRSYCSLFRFERQSLLDGLRMFLAAFRLPGEAQQIDRILQAFSDSCGQVCDESSAGRLKLFSEDPKRASDTAYLLSFSIIMLNTDRHNTNIREDRKMSCDDFIKNNTDYGRDITEPGRAFPKEYLKSIYDSIREEEIRTEGEGAEGAMTVERWKDVLRGSTIEAPECFHPTVHDAEDLTELILEHVWKPIVSALGALWGALLNDDGPLQPYNTAKDHGQQYSGMLGAQGARLGMDLAVEMLRGVRKLGRVDIFRKIFFWVCDFTGLLGDYSTDAVERTWALSSSVEGQSAVVTALSMAVESGDFLDDECWRRVWLILMELRDLKVIPIRSAGAGNSVLFESDPDLLTESARRDWTICLIKGDMNLDLSKKSKKPGSLFGAFGRALFGSDVDGESQFHGEAGAATANVRSVHGKDELVVWDDGAPSDDEDDSGLDVGDPTLDDDEREDAFSLSPGAKFEDLLIKENIEMSKRMDAPVTGLERVEETRRYQRSPRAQVRDRFRHTINFKRLVSDTRFLDLDGVMCLLKALVDLVAASIRSTGNGNSYVQVPPKRTIDRTYSDGSASSNSFAGLSAMRQVVSPASEAFAEVLICEIALKNKDRLKTLWTTLLQDHYVGRLTFHLMDSGADRNGSGRIAGDPGLEKRISGLLRLSLCAMKREDVTNEVLACWSYVLPVTLDQCAVTPLLTLDRHFGEGLWRIACETESMGNLNMQGWEGLLSLLRYTSNRGSCATHPGRRKEAMGRVNLLDDDVALQTYRSVHLLLHSCDVARRVPIAILDVLRTLVQVGERRQYGQLSIASLDLLNLILENKVLPCDESDHGEDGSTPAEAWSNWWRKIVEIIAEATEMSSDTVRKALAP